MSTRLKAARAAALASARSVIFGANTQGAGFSESHRGQSRQGPAPFSATAVRIADDESPALIERSLDDGSQLFDLGDLPLTGDAAAQMKAVGDQVEALVRANKRFLCLGGDHLVKYACLEGIARVLPKCAVLYLDAHPDCVADARIFYGSILHHAWALPTFSPSLTTLLALRQVNHVERDAIAARKPGIVWARDFTRGVEHVAGLVKAQLGSVTPLYVSIDLDGLSPADAPAVEAPFPGGPGVLEVLAVLETLAPHFDFVGADVSEFLVEHDPSRLTALTTARLMKELAAMPWRTA